jgi:hypothetical protein
MIATVIGYATSISSYTLCSLRERERERERQRLFSSLRLWPRDRPEFLAGHQYDLGPIDIFHAGCMVLLTFSTSVQVFVRMMFVRHSVVCVSDLTSSVCQM